MLVNRRPRLSWKDKMDLDEMGTPATIYYKGTIAKPEEWATLVGVTFVEFQKKAVEVGWEEACNLDNYEENEFEYYSDLIVA